MGECNHPPQDQDHPPGGPGSNASPRQRYVCIILLLFGCSTCAWQLHCLTVCVCELVGWEWMDPPACPRTQKTKEHNQPPALLLVLPTKGPTRGSHTKSARSSVFDSCGLVGTSMKSGFRSLFDHATRPASWDPGPEQPESGSVSRGTFGPL